MFTVSAHDEWAFWMLIMNAHTELSYWMLICIKKKGCFLKICLFADTWCCTETDGGQGEEESRPARRGGCRQGVRQINASIDALNECWKWKASMIVNAHTSAWWILIMIAYNEWSSWILTRNANNESSQTMLTMYSHNECSYWMPMMNAHNECS